jgi:hypothetical protein
MSLAKTAVTDSVTQVRYTGGLGKPVTAPLDKLQDKTDTATWHVTDGVIPTSTAYQVPAGAAAAGAKAKAVAAAAAVTGTVYNSGLWYGTYTDISGPISGSQVPMTFYNNYVRWVWVYVQYLDAAGNNLSANPSYTFPDTAYSQNVGLLPQIFTVLGVPIWDTNTLTKTLTFPPKAVTARILYCGLGNSALDGGWRQYFPANAYPNLVAPKDEVVVAACLTGIFTIGLTAFALCTDFAIAEAWPIIRKLIAGNFADASDIAESILSQVSTYTTAETAAATTLTGLATGADVAANGGTQNLWSILTALGTLIPKVLFNPSALPLIAEIAGAVLSEEAATDLVKAIPILGQIMAVITVVGDAATLAEAIGETAASPWVIQNSVSLSYPVAVAVSKDDGDATWPATAQSYRLEASIDGATVLAPITGTVAGGTQSQPIVVSTSAPFGGDTIKWSIVVMDGDGHQVGTGAVQYPNNDAANLPSAVEFAITELAAWVDASTVFSRTPVGTRG